MLSLGKQCYVLKSCLKCKFGSEELSSGCKIKVANVSVEGFKGFSLLLCYFKSFAYSLTYTLWQVIAILKATGVVVLKLYNEKCCSGSSSFCFTQPLLGALILLPRRCSLFCHASASFLTISSLLMRKNIIGVFNMAGLGKLS